MTGATRFFWLAALMFAPGAAFAQGPLTTRGAAFFETYSFGASDSGKTLIYKTVSELTVPIGADVKLGRRGSFAVSSGFAMVKLVSNDPLFPSQRLSGPLDTETRLSWELVPGKLIVLANGVVPTGSKTVQREQLAILGAISSDVIGYSAPSLGSGGNLGGGVVGAVPVGKFSAGFGATYKQALSYQPLAGQTRVLQPGSELRFRTGFEGAAARRTFVRVAAILARSSRDRIADTVRNGVGTRVIAYLSVNQAFGKASVTVYGFDVYRGSPQVEPTPTGAAILPKGNLISAGARLDYAVSTRTTLSPRLEVRGSAAAADTASAALQRLGSSFRFGVDARQVLKTGMAAVLQAGGVVGSLLQAGQAIPFSGLRAALSLEYTP